MTVLIGVSAVAVTSNAPAHKLTRPAAERHLSRTVDSLKTVIEDPNDPTIPTATTTVTDMLTVCDPPRRRGRHRHTIVCGYLMRVMIHPNPGSSEQHRVLFCGDPRVLVKFRSKASRRRLRLVRDTFRCVVVENAGEGPAGAPQGLGGTPPPPPPTGPPPG